MDRDQLYTQMADRKSKPKDFEPYKGDNGRVNKALQLYRSGKLKSGGVQLDVGGGIGDLGFALREAKLFEKTIVFDIAAKNLEAARKKGNYVAQVDVDRHGFCVFDSSERPIGPGDLGKDFCGPFAGDYQVDAISALDFIEHIVDPVTFARHCHNQLKPGGEVFINTPNIRFWRHIEQLVYMGTFPHTSGDRDVYHGGHLAFYTKNDLEEIFGMAGFTGFERFKDEECYEQPHDTSIAGRTLSQCKSRDVYVDLCLEFGCPNLLFKAVKP
jgi:2-polyprenyl-3-methyl-5-hydroxy-6-metoxy-1,4-benzoquinol methylase